MNRTIKIITATALFTILLTCTPKVLAGPYTANPDIHVEWDKNITESPFLPIDRKIEIPLKINFRVIGYFAEIMMPYYNDTLSDSVELEISVNSTPKWSAATISPIGILVLPKTEWRSFNATLSVKIDDDALAFRDGIVTIKIESFPFGVVQHGIFHVEIPFRPGFLPILKIKADDATKQINPQQTASFNIDLENLGNAKTKVICETIDTPKDWIVNIDSNVTLGSGPLGENTKESLSLDVKPPYDFGYHTERELIKVSIKPIYYGGEYDSILEGKEYILSFVVQSKGFSTPGFEFIFVFFALIALITAKKSKYKKNRGKGER